MLQKYIIWSREKFFDTIWYVKGKDSNRVKECF